MKEPKDFIDQWGLFDKHNMPDGGDSCNRVGLYWTLLPLLAKKERKKYEVMPTFEQQIKKVHPHPGVLIRHSNLEWDSSDWDRNSRDQMIPIISACGLNSKKELSKLTKGHAKRGFLFMGNTRQNGATKRNHGQGSYSYAWRFPDVTLFEVWALFIRAFNAWFLWPLLVIFDLETLGGAILWRWFPKHNIAINHMVVVLYGKARLPTPTMWLARKIMPPERLIKLIGEHFRDFRQGDKVMDMEFFEQMFEDAWNELKGKK